ncbi:hypothetical protein [Mesorhizobium sp. CAU 1741]|uniref:hypothetical protein n=1 Tax=Mesorhizobium sp. CAU 1741 TaxID=3140366 RepID=UPI00325B8DCE
MQPFIGLDPDLPTYGKILRQQDAARRQERLAPLPPLKDRVAEAMREIAAIRGSCDREDLELRFPDEDLTDAVLTSAKKLAGRTSQRRVA